MEEIKMAAYAQFGLGALSIVLGLISGSVYLWPLALIGLVLLVSGYLTFAAPTK